MALVKFIETTSDKLDSLPIVEGRFVFTRDDGKFYLDSKNSTDEEVERFLINDGSGSSSSGDSGDTEGLGALAYKDSATGTITPAGTVSVPTFTGDSFEVLNIDGDISISYTPEGTISAPTISISSLSLPYAKDIATEDLDIDLGSAIDPIPAIEYTPTGTVSAPTITVTPTTSTVYSITGTGSLPSYIEPDLYYEYEQSTRTLSFFWDRGSFSTGSLPTRSAVSCVTGVTATSSVPVFTGATESIFVDFTGCRLSAPINTTYTTNTSVVNLTATATAPVFTGTAATLTANPNTVTSTITPTGTISQPIFTGTSMTVRVS